jgi:hypothetical protein
MLRLKNVTLFLVLLMTVGCATQKLTVISPAGDRFPDPFYTAGTTDGSQMRFTWFYVQEFGYKDLDGTIQRSPVHLDRNKKHFIDRKKTHSLKLILRVFNPGEEEYTVFMSRTTKYNGDVEMREHIMAGKSFLTSNIEIYRDNDLVLRTKKFKYSVE